MIEKLDTALEYLDKIFSNNPNFTAALIVKGWVEFRKGKKTVAADCFKKATSQVNNNYLNVFCQFLYQS